MKRFYIGLLLLIFVFGVDYQMFAQSSTHRVEVASPKDAVSISVADNQLIVKNLPKDTTIEIYSIMGTKVTVIKAKAGDNEYLLNLAKGYYIVKIGAIVKKIAVK